MTDTQRRIKEYKAALPGLKERVVAVALLLAISLTMVVSASFAWYTLSQAPELSLVSTTVAANGNLEIALAQTTYIYQTDENGEFVLDENGEKILIPVVVEPDESAVGDSSAAEGNTLVSSNVKWGNLVNLSDSSYGLEHISLRPALLSGYNLTKTPLYGATYSNDGRVQDISETYEYATWTTASDGTEYFAAGSDSTYGVRAITSVTYENITGNAIVTGMWGEINNAYAEAQRLYLGIISGETMVAENVSCMDALSTLMEIYVQDKADTMLGNGSSADYSGVVTYAYRLVVEFYKVIEAEGEALLYMANLQAYLKDNSRGTETFKTIDELLSYTDAQLWDKFGVKLDSLKTYRTSRANIQKSIEGLEPLAVEYEPVAGMKEQSILPAVTWAQIVTPIQYLVNIGTTEIEGMAVGQLSRDDLTGLLGILQNNSERNKSDVIIYDGALADTEQRLGDNLRQNETSVSVFLNASVLFISIKKDIFANVVTDAEGPFTSNTDRAYTASLENTGTGGDAVAKDTYGMAIDFWVRTNVEGSYLMLEGNVIYETEDAMTTNKNGEETQLYIMTDADGATIEVYQMVEDAVDENGNKTGEMVTNWYNANSHTLLGTNTELTEAGCKFEAQTIDIVVGFQGENRIWENWEELMESGYISEDSTTQGAGSCYIFYADNPTDQTRILDLLDSFTIAFLDKDGNNIATAKLDTENAYAINGKVTVPLKMITGATYTDEDGNEYTGITALEANEAQLITAVVYLDGSKLSNENVLAAGEIEGRLNIQFGSSMDLTAGENSELQAKYRTITAVAADETETSHNSNDPIEYEYDGKTKEVTVTLNIAGDQPINVSGFFVRSISATQGTKTESKNFTKNDDGTWSATFDLSKPGTYTFSSVIADGSEYVLDDTPTIKIAGLAIDRLQCNYSSGQIMTADNSLEVTVTAEINADPELQPSQVRALFVGAKGTPSEGKEFTAIMTYNKETNEWTGAAKIDTSGTYNLAYLVMDGEYNDLADADGKYSTTLIVYLGLTARVWRESIVPPEGSTNVYDSTTFEYTEPVTLGMKVKILDNTGNEMQALTDVWLYYHSSGSALDQDGMNGEMYWNAETGFYEGNLRLDAPGIYSFNRLTVTTTSSTGESTSTISKSTNPPVFTAISPEPPSYNSYIPNEYQFVPNGGASLSVNLEYADAATVWAVIKNINSGEEYLVPSSGRTADTENGYYTFTFPVPENGTDEYGEYIGEYIGNYPNKQDGEWTLTKLCFQNVYANDKMYTLTDTVSTDPDADKYYGKVCHVITVTDEITSYVVHTVNVELDGTYSDADGDTTGTFDETTNTVVLGKNTHYFMDSHTTNVTYTIKDWKGEPIRDIADVTWSITHKGDQSAKGGYTGGTYGTKPVELSGSGTTYTTANAETLQLAGTYSTVLSFNVGTTKYEVSGPAYEIWSIVPTVKITSINPASGTHSVDNTSETSISDPSQTSGCNTTYTLHSAHTTATSSLAADGLSAIVYFQCFHSGTAGDYHYYYNSDNSDYGIPQVTITLSEISEFTSATLNFNDSSKIYSGLTYTGSGLAANGTWETTGGGATYSWTDSDTSVTRYIGYSWNQKSRAWDNTNANGVKEAAGTITANTLTVVYGGTEYVFTIPTITINNPY